jgi:hypothetical protein
VNRDDLTWSVDDLEAVLLNDRIRQDFPLDTIELHLGFFATPAIQVDDEKLALPDVFDSLVSQSGEGVMDGLTLRVENRALRHDPDVCFHARKYSIWD